jgi:LysM repeat protein
MGAQRQSYIRLLAPASLALFAVVFLIVVVASLGGGDGESSTSSEQPARTSERSGDRAGGRARSRASGQRGNPRFYTVKPGDNLAAIAQETGVPLEELRSLNPELDPQGLVSGQRVRLRESGG